MPVGTVSFKYTTKSFPIKKSFDTRVNVKDTVEYLRMSTVFNDGGVGVAFINAPKNSVDKNILIKDTSIENLTNSRKILSEMEFFSSNFESDFAGFDITDIVTVVEGEKTPLYLWHDLTDYINISKIEVLDGNLNPVKSSLYSYIDESQKLGYERKGIYTNLKCNFSQRDNTYEVYYVRFINLDSNEIETVLLNAYNFYQQTSFVSDRNKREFILNKVGNKYQIEMIFDSLNYSPTPVSSLQRFYIKSKNKGSIYVEKPAASLVTQRWNLRISPGDFIQDGRRYWVPEYYTQLYSPAFPFRLEKEREVKVFNGNILYTDLYPISNLGIAGFFLYVIVKDEKGSITKAFTNDPDADTYVTKLGFVTDIFYEKDVIESISETSGFIKINQKILSTERVYISYRYQEDWFTYSDLSVNPSITSEILGKRIVIYCKPDEDERSIHHIISDDLGLVLNSSESPFFETFSGKVITGTETSLVDHELLDIDFYSNFEIEILSGKNSGLKRKVLSYDITNKALQLDWALPVPLDFGDSYRIIKRINDYESNGIQYKGFNGYSSDRFYLKLADVYVIQNLNINDINSYDSRILGGGLKENREEAGLQLQDEARWFWDIGNFDGTPYPGMGAVLVRLPRYILKEIGGSFERKQVREIVSRHMADGSYPLISYYDESTEITKVTPGDKNVYLEWDLINASEYRVYMGNSPDNLFLFAKQPGTRNYIEIKELENNKIYYVQVEPVVGGIERLRSRTISFMPFNNSDLLPPIKYNQGKFLGGTYE